MIELKLSTTTQRRPFLPFLPLTVCQRRRRSLMILRQRLAIAATAPNRSQPQPRTLSPTDQLLKLQCVRSSDLSKTDPRTPQIPIDRVGETEPLPARDFVPWRFSDACRSSASMSS